MPRTFGDDYRFKMQALPYIILGAFLTIGTVLFIAGCAVSKNWWPMLSVIPGLFSLAFVYWYMKFEDDSYEGGCHPTSDGIMFLLVLGIISIIAMPIVFNHIGILKDSFSLGMNYGGVAAYAVGFGVYMYLDRKDNDFANF